MTSTDELLKELLEEVSKFNSELLEFFETNRQLLENNFLSDLEFHDQHNIAVILHRTMNSKARWMEIVSEMGIENHGINWIDLKSDLEKELPIYIAMRGPLHRKTKLNDFIQVLKNNARFDVLREMKPLVQGLFEKLTSPTSDFEDNITDIQMKENVCFANYKKSSMQQCDTIYSSHTMNNKHVSEKKYAISDITANVLCNTNIKVVILYAEADTNVVKKLSTFLQDNQINVRTLDDLDYLLMIDTSETIRALLNEVDFIIIVISEEFLNQIHCIKQFSDVSLPNNNGKYTNELNNLYIYKLLFNDYLQNKCFNFRVIPVRVPKMERHPAIHDALLYYSLLLWEEVPKLIKIIYKMKKILYKK